MIGSLLGKLRSALAARRGDPIALREVLKREGCRASRFVVEAAREIGVYELVIEAARMGCNVPKTVLEEALVFTLLAGEGKWAVEAARLLGRELPRGGVVYAYCSGETIEVLAGGLVLSSRSLPDSASWRLVGNPVDSVALALGAEVLAEWGCSSSYPWRVDVRLLSAIAIPEAGGFLTAAAYHLDVHYDAPVEAVRGVAERAVWLLSEAGVDWGRLPAEASRAARLPARRPPGLKSRLLTDRPRLVYGVVKPYTLEAGEPRGEGLSYAAWASARVMESRRGDPARVLGALEREGPALFWTLLENIIATGLRGEASLESLQVEPWHAALVSDQWAAPGQGVVEVDCLRPLDECLETSLEPSWARRARSRGYMLPEAPTGTPGFRARPRYWAPERYSARLGVEPSSSSKPRIRAVAPDSPGPEDALLKAAKLASGRRPLLVVPGRAMVKAAVRLLQATPIQGPGDADRWISEGGLAVSAWGDLLETPEILGGATSVVLVLPEVFLRGGPKARLLASALRGAGEEYFILDYWLDRVEEVAAKLGGLAVSYSLAQPRGWKPPRGSYANEDIRGEVLEAFAGVVRGAKPRRGQETVLGALSAGYEKGVPSTVMAVLPTGYGKSAIFQSMARAASRSGWGAYTLVISPLKALMRDQVESASRRELAAAYVDSSLPPSTRRKVFEAAKRGLLDILYISPERFGDPLLEDLISSSPPALVVLDEAHSLARWGMTFRPSYLYTAKRVLELRGAKSWPPLLALTATATPDVAESILASLGAGDAEEVRWDEGWDKGRSASMKGSVMVRGDPVRDNIVFAVKPTVAKGAERLRVVVEAVKELSAWANSVSRDGWVGVVFTSYVKSRRHPEVNVDTIADALRGSGVEAEVYVYHGQMGERLRKEVEELVSRGGGRRIVVATKAFGMGVDIPNIRWVIHATPSDSLEDYVQEAGRAGRDGLQAVAVMLYNPEDFKAKLREIVAEMPRPSELVAVHNILASITRALGSRRIVVPLEALPRSKVSLRALDILRLAGLLDYWLVGRPQLYRIQGDVPLEEAGWAVWLGESLAFGPQGLPRVEGLEPVPFKFLKCREGYGLKLLAGSRQIFSVGSCSEWEPLDKVGQPFVAVEWSPGYEPREADVISPSLFKALHSIKSVEARRLEALRAAAEEALAAAGRGLEESDKVLKHAIRRYFETPLAPRDGSLPRPGWEECGTLESCQSLLHTLKLLEDLLGVEGVRLAVYPRELAGAVASLYYESYGKPMPFKIVGLRRVAALAEKGSWDRLMDMGFIVGVAAKSSLAEKARSAFRDYPYYRMYVVRLWARGKRLQGS